LTRSELGNPGILHAKGHFDLLKPYIAHSKQINTPTFPRSLCSHPHRRHLPLVHAMSLSPDLTLSFSDFHGMLCSPSTARRCIKSFTGSVLFLPFNKFESATSSDLIPKSSLNLFTYYAMVIYSCTGISSLLGLTIGTCVTHTPTYEVRAGDGGGFLSLVP